MCIIERSGIFTSGQAYMLPGGPFGTNQNIFINPNKKIKLL